MTNTNGVARRIAQDYFDAMSNKDINRLMALADDDIACFSPLGDLVGIESFRGFSEGFAKMINKLTLIAAFGDDEQAVIVYESDTLPVKSAFVAEHIIAKNGKIVSTRVIYDGTPFAEYAARQAKH